MTGYSYDLVSRD